MKLTSWPTFISTPFISPSSLATSSAVRMANCVSSSARRSAGVTTRRARLPAKRVPLRAVILHIRRERHDITFEALRARRLRRARRGRWCRRRRRRRGRGLTIGSGRCARDAGRRGRTCPSSSWSSAVSTAARSAAMASRSGSAGGLRSGSTGGRLVVDGPDGTGSAGVAGRDGRSGGDGATPRRPVAVAYCRAWRAEGAAGATCRPALLMLAPSAVILGVFVIYPLVQAIWLGHMRCNAAGRELRVERLGPVRRRRPERRVPATPCG